MHNHREHAISLLRTTTTISNIYHVSMYTHISTTKIKSNLEDTVRENSRS